LDKKICFKKKRKKEGEFFGENVFFSSSSVNFTKFPKILEIFNIQKLEKKKKPTSNILSLK